jgi:hypothetical protein
MPNQKDVIAITFCAFFSFLFSAFSALCLLHVKFRMYHFKFDTAAKQYALVFDRETLFFAFTGRLFYGFEKLHDKTIVRHNTSLETNK